MNHDHKKHLLIMLACCLVPLALILSMGIFGLGALPSLVPVALVLICPLMMIFMMRGLGYDHGNTPHSKTQVTVSDSQAPDETITRP